MAFFRSSRRPIEKVSSDSSVLSFDLLSNLTYMAAVSVAEVPRDIIFRFAMAQTFKTSIYIKQVYLLTKQLGFEYARSFHLVSTKAKAETVKTLLLRFASSLTTGQTEHEFLSQEARVERDQFINLYTRSVATLQKWADAYAAILVSVTLIVVVSLISTMIFDFGNTFVLMVTFTMALMSFVGVYVIYKSVPTEIKTYTHRHGPKERRKATFLLLLFGPIGTLMAVVLAATSGMGPAFLVFGLCLMPAGVYAYMDDSKVSKLDDEVDKFFQSLGSTADALGTTITAAMARLDRRSLISMEPYNQEAPGPASSPSEDYLTVLAGQRQWMAPTDFAGCPGRPPDSFANSARAQLPRQSS